MPSLCFLEDFNFEIAPRDKKRGEGWNEFDIFNTNAYGFGGLDPRI